MYTWRSVLLLCLLSACYVPLPYSETLSPRLIGSVPVSTFPQPQLLIKLSTNPGDSSCVKPRAQAIVDASGRFEFARTVKRHRGFWGFPPVEYPIPPTFYLCEGTTNTAMRPLYSSRVYVRTDSLACQYWVIDGPPKLGCNARHEPIVEEGGTWEDSRGSGHFEVARDYRYQGWRFNKWGPQVSVIWVEHLPKLRKNRFRKMTHLKLGTEIQYVDQISIDQHEKDWHLKLTVVKVGANRSEEVIYLLRAPGQVVLVE